MKVKNLQTSERDNCTEISAEIDGFRLWYRLPGEYPVSGSGDPFLAAALFPAMSRGEKLEFEPNIAVSPKFLENVASLQDIFHCWNPVQLTKVPIDASRSPAKSVNAGAISFFSGGVDSTYTFLKHVDEIDKVVNIHGLDFSFSDISGTPTTFVANDIKDLGQVVSKLLTRQDPVSAHVGGLLSEATHKTLRDYEGLCAGPGQAESALVEDLNRIIAGRPIYDPRRFAGVHLRPQTKQLLADGAKGQDVRILNRMLLEDAFSREIAGKYSGTYEAVVQRNTRFAQEFGKSLIGVETNFYAFGYRYNLSRNLSHGACLGSVAMLLGFPRVFVPASYSYDQLFPLGSHPLTDRLWSNESMEIVHDGCEAGRTDKLKRICKVKPALDNLQVCFNSLESNCGKCMKCVRTMTTLRLLGASSSAFPPLPSLKELSRRPIRGEIELAFLKENIDLALQVGDRELGDALLACMKRNERKAFIMETCSKAMGDAVRRVCRAIRGSGRGFPMSCGRIGTTP